MAPKPAVVRFYVDADTLGLAKILTQLRADVTYPGDPGGVVHRRERPACPVDQANTPDQEWIADVAARGWVTLTLDKAIARRHVEREFVRSTGGRLIAVSSRERLDNWRILEIVMTQWRWIESMCAHRGPFIWAITRTSRSQLL